DGLAPDLSERYVDSLAVGDGDLWCRCPVTEPGLFAAGQVVRLSCGTTGFAGAPHIRHRGRVVGVRFDGQFQVLWLVPQGEGHGDPFLLIPAESVGTVGKTCIALSTVGERWGFEAVGDSGQ